MTKLAALAAVAALSVAAAGCGNNPSQPASQPKGTFRVVDVNVHGRTVACVTWSTGHAGGITCDWESAKPTAR